MKDESGRIPLSGVHKSILYVLFYLKWAGLHAQGSFQSLKLLMVVLSETEA